MESSRIRVYTTGTLSIKHAGILGITGDTQNLIVKTPMSKEEIPSCREKWKCTINTRLQLGVCESRISTFSLLKDLLYYYEHDNLGVRHMRMQCLVGNELNLVTISCK